VTTVTDTLPAGFGYVAGSTGGTLGAGEPVSSGQTLTWSGPFSVPVGSTRTVTFHASATQTPGTHSNTAGAGGTNFTPVSTGPTANVRVNAAPVAVDDTLALPEDGQGSVTPLANDTDPDGDPLSVASITQPSHGTATLNPDGTVTYVPAPNYTGPDTFTVTVCDPTGACATSTTSITVVAVNDPPVVNPDTVSLPEDGQGAVTPLANDSDPDGDPLAVSSITQPSHGTATLNPDGTVTYVPAPNYNGPDTFTVTVCDPTGACGTSTTSVTVVPVNDPPVVVDDSGTVQEDGT